MPKIDVACLNALRPKPKPSENPPETARIPSDDGADPTEVDRVPMGRTLRKRKEKVAKHLKRGANEKERESFQKRVFRIPLEKSFEEAYFTHRLWMSFRETTETEEDIRRMFCEAREKMRNRITLKKKSDPGKFAIPCTVKGIEFPHALCNQEHQSASYLGILTHEEFAARYPHRPSPVYVKIDRQSNTPVDRQYGSTIDRQPPAPIGRRAPLTYPVQMPKIDVACLNALRPKPKPSENPPETARIPSDDGADPTEVDRVPMGRTLRKRKEKVAKHLKRGANEKERESFQKRVFRIPLEKSFEEAYFTHRLWMSFRETTETEEDIRRMFCEAREKMRNRITLKKKSDPGKFAIPCTVKGIEFPHALCNQEHQSASYLGLWQTI
ncbi:hypothetical protein F2Q69_00022806 [Brassica cretica]|uniref:Uncharacterized protein n=1 Tax=Brassica cretica TaxID=69181 RepID=A0A8S9QAC8_BRACR|nr:hypothetical protein F2Q69_00022806 [Brassica cretica]